MESTDTELSSNLSIPDLIAKLKTSKTGLSQEEADQRLSRYGPNELKNKKPIPFWLFSRTSGDQFHG